MTYEKPIIVKLSAVEVILYSTTKSPRFTAIDANLVDHNASVNAYEADE